MKEKEEKKLKLTGKITPAVIIRPTSSLRINMCSGRGGTLEQRFAAWRSVFGLLKCSSYQ